MLALFLFQTIRTKVPALTQVTNLLCGMGRPMSNHEKRPVALPDDLDQEKMAEAALALLSLTSDQYGSVWKGLDWDLMNLLFNKGWISDPQTKNKSVQLSAVGRESADRFRREHFSRK